MWKYFLKRKRSHVDVLQLPAKLGFRNNVRGRLYLSPPAKRIVKTRVAWQIRTEERTGTTGLLGDASVIFFSCIYCAADLAVTTDKSVVMCLIKFLTSSPASTYCNRTYGFPGQDPRYYFSMAQLHTLIINSMRDMYTYLDTRIIPDTCRESRY